MLDNDDGQDPPDWPIRRSSALARPARFPRPPARHNPEPDQRSVRSLPVSSRLARFDDPPPRCHRLTAHSARLSGFGSCSPVASAQLLLPVVIRSGPLCRPGAPRLVAGCKCPGTVLRHPGIAAARSPVPPPAHPTAVTATSVPVGHCEPGRQFPQSYFPSGDPVSSFFCR